MPSPSPRGDHLAGAAPVQTLEAGEADARVLPIAVPLSVVRVEESAADPASYAQAQVRVIALYADPDTWTRKAILNVAASGKFSSDRTIAEYATKTWNAEPCPIPDAVSK